MNSYKYHFLEDLNSGITPLERLYFFVHYLARITVYDNGLITLIPQIYPKTFLKDNFGENALVIHTVLESIETFEDFENEKSFLKYLFTG